MKRSVYESHPSFHLYQCLVCFLKDKKHAIKNAFLMREFISENNGRLISDNIIMRHIRILFSKNLFGCVLICHSGVTIVFLLLHFEPLGDSHRIWSRILKDCSECEDLKNLTSFDRKGVSNFGGDWNMFYHLLLFFYVFSIFYLLIVF